MLKLLETPSSSLAAIQSLSHQTESSQANKLTSQAISQIDDFKFDFATRVRLDVTINAPLIIVPENSSSSNAILLDCGVVTVRTSLSVLKDYYVKKDVEIDTRCLNDRCRLPPVIEIQKVTLSKMEISKYVYFWTKGKVRSYELLGILRNIGS